MRLETKQVVKVPELKLLKTEPIAEEIRQHIALQEIVAAKPVISAVQKEAPKKLEPAVVAVRPAPKIVQKKQPLQPIKAAIPPVPHPLAAAEVVPLRTNYLKIVEAKKPSVAQEHRPYLFRQETPVYDIASEPVSEDEETADKMDQTSLQPEQPFLVSIAEKPDLTMLQIELPFLIFPTEAETPLDWQSATAETEQPPSITEQLTEYFETLEPEKAEESVAILEVIMDKFTELQFATVEADGDPEQVQQELEILCTRLLVCMGTEPTPELVKQFMLLLKEEHRTQQEAPIQLNWDEGTHERKQPVDFFPDNSQPARTFSDWIGIYALRLAAPRP